MDSVVNQTYRNLEILVIDDGSTDGSGVICDEYCIDPRVQVFHQENQGVSKARNVGLDRAIGEYIAFLDPDDAYHPEFIQRMLDVMDNTDIVVCQYATYHLTLNSPGQTGLRAKEGSYNRKEALRGLVDGIFSTSVCNKLYQKNLWKKIRFPEGHFYEDIEPLYRCFDLCSQLYYLNQTLYYHRQRPGSTTHTFSSKYFKDWKMGLEQEIAFVKSHIPEVFDETHLKKAQQKLIPGSVRYYARGGINVREVKNTCKDIDLGGCSFRVKSAYQIIRFCPWLLKILYPIYQPFRLLMLKVLGR